MLRAITLGAAIGLAAGAAFAPSAFAQSTFDPTVTSICIEPGGRTLPVTCRAQPSHIDPREDICQCLDGGQQVTISVCPPGVRPPAESAAYERARAEAVKNGSVVGATWQGRPMCVAPRNPTR